MKNIISVLKSTLTIYVCITMLFTTCAASPFIEEEKPPVYCNETFNNCLTGEIMVEDLTITGGKVAISETGASNKSLYLRESIGNTSLIHNSSSEKDNELVFSVDVMTENEPVSLTLAATASSSSSQTDDVVLVNINNNVITTTDGKKAGVINNHKFTTISAIVKDNKVIDIYVNYKRTVKNWKLTKKIGQFIAIRKTNSSPCYIDNIRLYKGDKPIKDIDEAGFLHDYVDRIAVDDKKGDHTYFDNRDCRTNGKQYYPSPGVIMAPKTNILECTRLINYQSPDRTDYIYMERIDPNADCYFDVPFNIYKSAGMEEKKYSYFKLEGDVKIEEFDQYFQFPQIRDNVTSGQNNYIVNITTDGSVVCGGAIASKVVPKGEWFHYLVAINLQNRIIDVYVNDKKVLEAPITNNNIQELYHMRISLGTGEQLGKVYLDNFDITGLDQPIVDGVETRTSVFSSDAAIEDFLDGKIAMHTYGNNIYKNGVKSSLETKGIYDENTEQYYLCTEELAKAFDIELKYANREITGYVNINEAGKVTLNNGTEIYLDYKPIISNDKMYIPVRQFAQDILGKYVWWFKTGILIFTNDRPVKLDTSTWKYQTFRDVGMVTKWNDIDFLNAFLQYTRPDKDTLYSDLRETSGDNVINQHPRLILTKSDFDLHRQHYNESDDFLYTTLANKYIAEADKYVVDWEVPYKWDDAIRTRVNVSYKLLDKFFALGYAYQLTGDKKYAEAGYKIFEQASTYPDFNLAHILDTGASALGLAIGFDWLYDGFTPEQRELAKKVVREDCLDRLASGMYGRITAESVGIPNWHYFKSMNNFNAVITNGVIAASIATMEYDTDEALMYISDAMRSVEYSLQMLPPDGGWNEGVHYWELNMESFCVMLDSIESIFGSTYNLMDGQGMKHTVDYVINSFGATGINNFGDAVGEVIHSFDAFLYFGRELNNKTASKLRYDDLVKKDGVNSTMNDILFYDFEYNASGEEILEEFNPMLMTKGTELISFRDNFDFDKMQTYFSTHFGTTSGYHQHDDCGAFVLDLLGERWVHDLGQSEYNLENELGYKDWQLYRKRAEGHNMIILNPQNYTQSFITTQNEVIPISEAKSNQYGGYVYADMSKAYNKEANSMKLGYYIGDNFKSVTYRNEFNVSKETDVMWSMHTKADIIIDDDNTVYLSQNGKTVKIEVLCKNGTDIKWEDSDPVPLDISPQVPEQSKEEAFRKLKLTYKAGSGDNVLAIKIGSAVDGCAKLSDVPISKWELPKKTETKTYNCDFKVYYGDVLVDGALPVYDDVMPEFKVVTSDPEAIVEINRAKTIDEVTLVKVWDKTKTAVVIEKIVYYKSTGKDLMQFKEIPVMDISVNATVEPQNHKDNIIDSNMSTRWTGMSLGDYAIADIGSVQEIDGIAAAFWKGKERIYYFDVFVSTDGTAWTNVYTDGHNSEGVESMEVFTFDKPQKARYIKIVGKGNSATTVAKTYINLIELKILKNRY